MWNPRVTKITSRMVLIHHVVECCVSSGESTNVLANAIGQNDRSSIKRTVIRPHPHKEYHYGNQAHFSG